MRPFHIVLPSGAVWVVTLQPVLWVCALALAAGMFSMYLNLLHESVARSLDEIVNRHCAVASFSFSV